MRIIRVGVSAADIVSQQNIGRGVAYIEVPDDAPVGNLALFVHQHLVVPTPETVAEKPARDVVGYRVKDASGDYYFASGRSWSYAPEKTSATSKPDARKLLQQIHTHGGGHFADEYKPRLIRVTKPAAGA